MAIDLIKSLPLVRNKLTKRESPKAASHAAKVNKTKKEWSVSCPETAKEYKKTRILSIIASNLINKFKIWLCRIDKANDLIVKENKATHKTTNSKNIIILGFEGQRFILT